MLKKKHKSPFVNPKREQSTFKFGTNGIAVIIATSIISCFIPLLYFFIRERPNCPCWPGFKNMTLKGGFHSHASEDIGLIVTVEEIKINQDETGSKKTSWSTHENESVENPSTTQPSPTITNIEIPPIQELQDPEDHDHNLHRPPPIDKKWPYGWCPTKNAHFVECRPHCPKTCKNYRHPEKICKRGCNPYMHCQCNEGYVLRRYPKIGTRELGQCILPSRCIFKDANKDGHDDG